MATVVVVFFFGLLFNILLVFMCFSAAILFTFEERFTPRLTIHGLLTARLSVTCVFIHSKNKFMAQATLGRLEQQLNTKCS